MTFHTSTETYLPGDHDIAPVYEYQAINQDGGIKYHYSTRSDVEQGWTYDNLAFYAFGEKQSGTVPVYQYYAAYADGSIKYHYSTKPDVQQGWMKDKPLPAFYAYAEDQPFTTPVYQYYAPDQDGGIKYLYSTDPDLERGDWKREFTVFHVAISKDISADLAIDLTNLFVFYPANQKPVSLSEVKNRILILTQGDSFGLALEFSGKGKMFPYIAGKKVEYRISYMLEGFGANGAEKSYERVNHLMPDQFTYGPSETKVSIGKDRLSPGIYQIAAIFKMQSGSLVSYGYITSKSVVQIVQ